MLVPIDGGIRAKLQYRLWGYPGALSTPWLQEEAYACILNANAAVRRATGGRGYIQVWDALRTIPTQQHIFDQQTAIYRANHPELSTEQVENAVAKFVRRPSTVDAPPHATGGAVDVTIVYDGDGDLLGKFDDFSDYGSATYFDRYEPRNNSETVAKYLRQILCDAMTAAGFVGIPEEWWHWERGTRWWAEVTGLPIIYDTVVLPPQLSFPATPARNAPPRQPISYLGVAQVFGSAADRAASLRGDKKGHYYARTRHKNELNLAQCVNRLLGTEDTVFMPTGLSACLFAVIAVTPRNGHVVIDHALYYETKTSIHARAKDYGWVVTECNLDCASANQLSMADTIVCDHPRNWLLTCPDIRAIRSAKKANTNIIVDVSVVPAQTLIGIADIIVVSLSKYPSLGLTLGGAISAFDPTIAAKVRATAKSWGMAIAPDTADTIQRSMLTFDEHMKAVSKKAEEVSKLLKTLPFVTFVNIPDLTNVDGPCGGQLTFGVRDSRIAIAAEEIISHNAHGENFPLTLACTFGAAMTTFEFFSGRNKDGVTTSQGSEFIPSEMIRLGIGAEPISEILGALSFVLRAAAADLVPRAAVDFVAQAAE